MRTHKELAVLVMELNEDELFAVNRMIVERIRSARRVENIAARAMLARGVRVKYIGSAGRGLWPGTLGTVTAMGRSRVSVKFDNVLSIWRCPASMLEVVMPEVSGEGLIAAIEGELS